MGDIQESSTKVMFDCLLKLYKQGQLLLLDADHLMGFRLGDYDGEKFPVLDIADLLNLLVVEEGVQLILDDLD